MSNEELIDKIAEKIEDKLEEKFKRHMGILIEHTDKKIETIGEGHSILLRRIDEVKEELIDHKKITERGLDRLTIAVADIKEDLKTVTVAHDRRLKKVEEKIGV